MKENNVQTAVNNTIPSITPREFVRLWNIIFNNVKKLVCDINAFPCVVMSFENSESMSEKVNFVISRLNNDNNIWSSVGDGFLLSIEASGCVINVLLDRYERKEVLV